MARSLQGLPSLFGSASEVGQADAASPLRGAEVVCVTFGAPRVGSARLCVECNRHVGGPWRAVVAVAQVPRTWRVFSTSDVVPTVPPKYLWGGRRWAK